MTAYVYAIQVVGDELFKIGHTTNPQTRFTALSAQSPYPLKLAHLLLVESKPMAAAFECYALSMLAERQDHGEWVRGVDNVQDAFENIAPAVCVDADTFPVTSKRRSRPFISLEGWQARQKQARDRAAAIAAFYAAHADPQDAA